MNPLEKSLMLFDEFLKNTSREELERMFDEVESLNIPGPSIDEYVELFDSQYIDFYTPAVKEQYLDVFACVSYAEQTLICSKNSMDLGFANVLIESEMFPKARWYPDKQTTEYITANPTNMSGSFFSLISHHEYHQ